MRIAFRPTLAVVVAALLLPSVASAYDFHVAPQGGDSTEYTLQAALQNARTNSDPSNTIYIAPGFYDGTSGASDEGPFSYSGTKPLTIVGAGSGPDGTVIRAGSTDQDSALALLGSTSYEVSGLRLQLGVGAANQQKGLVIQGGGSASHVSDIVVETLSNTTTGHHAIELSGAAVAVQDATLDVSNATTGLYLRGDTCPCGGHAIGDVTIDGSDYGIVSAMEPGDTFTADRMRILGAAAIGVQVKAGNVATLRDLLIVLPNGSSGKGLWADGGGDGVAASTSIEGHNLTIVGHGGASQQGARAFAIDDGDQETIELYDTVIRDVPTPLVAGGNSAAQTATITTHTSSIPDTGNQETPGWGDVVTNTDGAVLKSSTLDQLGFADPAGGDFRLRWDSPLVDAGSTTAPSGGETDLLGFPRLVNGTRDIGANEYQRSAPVTALDPSATVHAGDALSVTAGGVDADALETALLTYAWSFGDGQTGTGRTIEHVWATPGDYTLTMTAADPLHLQSTPAQMIVHVLPVPSQTPATGGETTPGAATTSTPSPAPTAKPESSSPSAPRISGKPAIAGPAITLTLKLTAAGRAKLSLQRRAGRKWVAVKGSLTLSAKKGKNTFKLKGRKPFTGLKKGSYRIAIVTTDSAGKHPRKAVYATFSVR